MDKGIVIFGCIGLFMISLAIILMLSALTATTEDKDIKYLGPWLLTSVVLAGVVTTSLAIARGWF